MEKNTKPIKNMQKNGVKNYTNNIRRYKIFVNKQGKSHKLYLNQKKEFISTNLDNYKIENKNYINNAKEIRKSAKQEENRKELVINTGNKRPQSYAGINKISQNNNSRSPYHNNINNNKIYKSLIDAKETRNNNKMIKNYLI